MEIIANVLLSALASVTTAGAVIVFFGKRFIDNAFARNLQEHQSELDSKLKVKEGTINKQLAASKAILEDSLKKSSEIYLGDKAADRQYALEARKRLYQHVGPLRLQLLLAAASYVARINGFGHEKSFQISLERYFGKSTFFRLGRLLALSELTERQIAYADFAVDRSMIRLLRFKHGLYDCLSGSSAILDYPKVDWGRQVEHVFADEIPTIAAMMIIVEESGARAMRFDELEHHLSQRKWKAAAQPLPRLCESLEPSRTPILWLRFIAIAYLCASLLKLERGAVGLPVPELDLERLLKCSKDKHILDRRKDYLNAIRGLGLGLSGPIVGKSTKRAAATSARRRAPAPRRGR